MKKFIKQHILSQLPKRVVQVIERYNSFQLLRNFHDDQEPDIRMVRQLVNKGDLVVDIGANIGIYTKCLSELVGSEGKVVSIEPIPRTFDILKAMKTVFRLDNVELVNCAISDEVSLVRMEIPRYETGDPNFYQAHIVDKDTFMNADQITTQARTIDSLLADSKRPIAFIKCDVEDMELSCIKGAAKVIDLFKPAWLIETCSDPDDPTTPTYELFKILASSGYKAFVFNGQSLRFRRKGDRIVNYFFLLDKHMKGAICESTSHHTV